VADPVPLWWAAEGPPEAPPLVLLPDAHRPASIWPVSFIAGLAAAGWRVVLVDLRDQGRSPRAAEPFTVDDLASDVAGLLATVGPAHVVGHGLGATVALHLALRPDPGGLLGLTVAGGTGWFVDPRLPGAEEPAVVGLVWRSRLGERDGGDLVTALAREERLLAGPDDPGPGAAAAEVRRWLAHGFNPADGHRAAWLAAPALWDALCARPGPPLVVVHGRDDPLVPLAHGRRLVATVGRARLVEVADAGHALTPRLLAALLGAVGSPGTRPEWSPRRGR
jgi:pimeloyl-ACP methyl ester carboxylesterase